MPDYCPEFGKQGLGDEVAMIFSGENDVDTVGDVGVKRHATGSQIVNGIGLRRVRSFVYKNSRFGTSSTLYAVPKGLGGRVARLTGSHEPGHGNSSLRDLF